MENFRPRKILTIGAQTWGQEVRPVEFEIRHKYRIREPARIPTPFQNQSTKKSKCQLARVLPASREEPGGPRTRCLTEPVHHRTHHQEFDRRFDQQHQQHQKQFDREQRQKFIQNFHQKFDVDPEDQQNFIQKFDADPTEKFDQSNLNKTVCSSKQLARFDRVTLTRTPLKFDRAEPTRIT